MYCACVCLVTQLCLTLCNSVDCSLPGSSVHGVFQARILAWVYVSSSRASFCPKYWTWFSCVSCIYRWILYHWAIGEACCWDQGGFQWQAVPEGWGWGEVRCMFWGRKLNRVWGQWERRPGRELRPEDRELWRAD